MPNHLRLLLGLGDFTYIYDRTVARAYFLSIYCVLELHVAMNNKSIHEKSVYLFLLNTKRTDFVHN